MLDRRLEDGRIDVEGISGTSAASGDVVIIHVNSIERSAIPKSSGEFDLHSSVASKLVSEWEFLGILRDRGRQFASEYQVANGM